MTTNNDNATILEVFVFKTNICSDKEIERLTHILSSDKRISRWNIDRADIDNVLRIEGDRIHVDEVVRLLCNAAFQCEELPD